MISLRDKLALAMTSAGSLRALASTVGVTHQRLGRMLRVGSPGGLKHFPQESALTAAINQAFAFHKDISRDQARVDRIPFDPARPVFARRLPLQTGLPGDRVVVEHTQYIPDYLRATIIEFVNSSQRYYTFSVRSRINRAVYFRRTERRMGGAFGRRTQSELDSRAQLRGQLRSGVELGPIYTKYSNISAHVPPEQTVLDVSRKLREKHEPATGERGTALADQYLLQLYPSDYPHVSARVSSTKKRRRAKR